MNHNLKLELPIELESLREKLENSINPFIKINSLSIYVEYSFLYKYFSAKILECKFKLQCLRDFKLIVIYLKKL